MCYTEPSSAVTSGPPRLQGNYVKKVNVMRLHVRNNHNPYNRAILALAHLYLGSDPDTIVSAYNRNRARPLAYMNELVTISNELVTTDDSLNAPDCLQQKLLRMYPNTDSIHMYIRNWGTTTPSHYMILHKLDDGQNPPRFVINCNRLLQYKFITGRGIVIDWPSPDTDIAVRQSPIVTSTGVILADELLSSPELLRELHLSTEVGDLFSRGYKTEYSVWNRPKGKTAISIIAPSSNPFITPDTVEVIRTNPYAELVTRNRVTIYGDIVNDQFPDAPELSRHIVPYIKDCESFTPDEDTTANVNLMRLLRYTLSARLLPYIAVAKDTGLCDVYALSLHEFDDGELCPTVVRLAEDKKSEGWPTVRTYNHDGVDVFVPDKYLANLLYQLLFHSRLGDDVICEDAYYMRIRAVRGVLRTMGYTAWEHIQLALSNWGITLTEIELRQLSELQIETEV